MKDKTIDILGTIYTIEYIDNIETDRIDEFVVGVCDFNSYKIKIATKFKDGTDIPNKMLVRTLIYELMHAIFEERQHLKSFDNESIGECLAKCVQQLLN